jgi:hypothetical protein
MSASGRKRAGKRPDKHDLLVGAGAHFDHARESRYGEYVRPYKRSLVDVFVSEDALTRALKMASELFLTLEDRGQRVMLAPPSAQYHRADPELREGHKGAQDYYGLYGPGRWTPAQPTITLIGEIAVALTLFEIIEHVEARYDSTLHKYVRVPPPKPATAKKGRPMALPSPADWTTKHWMASGRLGLHAYAPQQGIAWSRYWYEAKPGDLTSMYGAIADELDRAPTAITKLIEKKKRDDEEWRRKRDAEHREWQRKEAERQRLEREAAREKEIGQTLGHWRMARDIRAYVAEVRALVRAADLEITKGGNAEDELAWALAYADRIDPLTSWRKDIESVLAERDGKPCPECGKVHGEQRDGEATIEATGPQAQAASPTAGDPPA